MSTPQSNQYPRRPLPGEATPGPVFHVGLPDLSHEYVEGDKRYFQWAIGKSDLAMAELAGWSVFPFNENNGLGTLELPMDTRSASSALAGAEAWQGEKDQILTAMTGYAQQLYERFGVVDTNLQLDSVGVTRGNEQLFMAPPHNIVEASDTEVVTWFEQLKDDLDMVLGSDPRREELTREFQAAMSFVSPVEGS